MVAVIETSHLTRTYGERRGIDAVDLRVDAGTLFGFLGPNGAGKTTTIRVLLGFLRPTSGSAAVFGKRCWNESHTIKRDVGYLPGDLRLWPWMTGESALRIVSAVHGMDLRPRGRALAERLGLELDVRARAMSRGMRQKLGLVLAMAHQPKLLILDEPTSGLDPIVQRDLQDYLRERAAEGDTVFFSSHTLSEVEQLCDRVAIVRDGCIVEDSTIDDLRMRAARHVTIEWRAGADMSAVKPPPGFTLDERTSTAWRGQLTGDAAGLLGWLNTQPVADLIIAPPDLEEVFHGYYHKRGQRDA